MLCLFIQEVELENKDLQERLSLLEAQLRDTPSEKVNVFPTLIYHDLILEKQDKRKWQAYLGQILTVVAREVFL